MDYWIIITLTLLTVAILVSCLIYYLTSKKLNFNIKCVQKEMRLKNRDESLINLAVISLRKVKGWNTMTVFYTILHYILNLSSILFSCISVYWVGSNNDNYSIYASVIAILAVTINLFLRCERKWATYRNVLSKGREETNNFIAGLNNNENIQDFVRQYANKIIEIEGKINDSDLT